MSLNRLAGSQHIFPINRYEEVGYVMTEGRAKGTSSGDYKCLHPSRKGFWVLSAIVLYQLLDYQSVVHGSLGHRLCLRGP